MVTPYGLVTLGAQLAVAQALTAFSSGVTAPQLADALRSLASTATEVGLGDVLGPIAEEAERLAEIGHEELDEVNRWTTHQTLASAQGQLEPLLQDSQLIMPETNLQPKNLMDGPSAFLGNSVRYLTKMEQHDLQEACLCLLTRAYTASEFSSLRAAEGILNRWHAKKTGTKLDTTWGRVLDEMTKEYPGEPRRPKELTLLSYLNKRRVEIDHPKRISTLVDAEATLLNVFHLVGDLEATLATK